MRFKSSEFLTNVRILMQGTIIAQAIPIVLSPLITRLYSPYYFGLFTVFLSVVNIGAIVVNGKLESAIYISKGQNKAEEIQMLFFVQNIFFCLIMVGFVAFLTVFWQEYYFLWLAPPTIFFAGWYVIAFALASADKEFRSISNGKLVKGMTIGVLSLVFGYCGYLELGLIVSYLLGTIFEVIYLVSKSETLNFGQPLQGMRNSARSMALFKKYSNFTYFFLPAALFQRTTLEMPVFYMERYIAETAAGQFGLMRRVVSAPIGILTRTIADVYRQKIGENIMNRASNRGIFFKHLKVVLLIGVVPTLLVVKFAPVVFAVIFGVEWREAGEYLQILAPMFLLQFAANPLGNITLLREKQKAALSLHFGHFIITFLAFFIGIQLGDLKLTLVLYALAYSIKYIVELWLAYRYSTPEKT